MEARSAVLNAWPLLQKRRDVKKEPAKHPTATYI